MTAPPSRRLWWKRKRWIAAALLWLGLAYVAGSGPADYAVARGWLSPAPVRPVYQFADATVRGLPPLWGDAFRSYRGWWRALGDRQRTRVTNLASLGVLVESDVDQGGGLLFEDGRGLRLDLSVGGRELAIWNARQTRGGYAWDGPVTLEARTVAALPAGTRGLRIGYFDGRLTIETDGKSVNVED